MPEKTKIDKSAHYEMIIRKVNELIDPSLDKMTNICGILSLLKYELDLFWAGLYMNEGNILKLGIFQGLPACTKILPGKGACGTAAAEGRTVILENVSEFPGYIACHSETKSEIVVPAIVNGKTVFVLDMDSTELNRFDEVDDRYLSHIAGIMAEILK